MKSNNIVKNLIGAGPELLGIKTELGKIEAERYGLCHTILYDYEILHPNCILKRLPSDEIDLRSR